MLTELVLHVKVKEVRIASHSRDDDHLALLISGARKGGGMRNRHSDCDHKAKCFTCHISPSAGPPYTCPWNSSTEPTLMRPPQRSAANSPRMRWT